MIQGNTARRLSCRRAAGLCAVLPYTIAIQQKDKQTGAKRLIVLSASLSDSEREVGESKGRGQRPQCLCVFCTVVILFKLFLDCYSIRACLKIEPTIKKSIGKWKKVEKIFLAKKHSKASYLQIAGLRYKN